MKTKNTLAKVIEAQPEAEKTGFAALYGRRLSKIESCCHVFLETHCTLPELDDKENDICRELNIAGTDKELALKSFSEIKVFLSIQILEAILKRDSKAIQSLADFVKRWTPHRTPEDGLRWEILLLKKRNEIAGRKMTVKQVAQYLNRRYKKNSPTQTDDGLAGLRRLLKRLKFPIASDAKGRPIIKTQYPTK
jgi:hypothetical protein